MKEAAAALGLAPITLQKSVADRQHPESKRKVPAHLHEYYLTAHFVKDTKGRKSVTKGPYPWHIEDWRVHEAVIRRKQRLFGLGHEATEDLYERLARLL